MNHQQIDEYLTELKGKVFAKLDEMNLHEQEMFDKQTTLDLMEMTAANVFIQTVRQDFVDSIEILENFVSKE